MSFCNNCGAELGLGRFCTNCGTPVAAPTEPTEPASNLTGDPAHRPDDPANDPGDDPGATAVRPAVPPTDPAEESPAERTQLRMPAVQPDASPSTRYPLFADELPTRSPDAPAQDTTENEHGPDIAMWVPPAPAASAPPTMAEASGPEGPGTHRDRDRSGRAGWIVAVVLLLILCSVGVAWLVNRDGSDDVAGRDTGDNTGDNSQTDEDLGSDASGTPTDGNEDGGSDPKTPKPADEPPVDLAESASASGPAPVPPSTDFTGTKFSYPASNMLDGDPESAYRIKGGATGSTVKFDLGEKSTIREVGMVNGFAKSATSPGGTTIDWYAKNRRILEVEWIFDDGQSVTQSLGETTDLQTIAVDDAMTRTIRMRITKVSAPGKGKWSKDVTAISSVLLRGSTS